MDYEKDFRKFALSNTPMHGSEVDSMMKQYSPKGYITPYILEEREMRVTQLDIFSRMMRERILWVNGVVNDNMSNIVAAQLMYLDNVDSETDIIMNINTPGGSVSSGLSMVATMEYITPDISTVNICMAASMGSILLGAGTKGKRHALKYSRVMLHQVSSGMGGNIQDIDISYEETKKYNNMLFGLLGEYTDKDPETVKTDATRDLWLNPEEAVAYGIVDSVVQSKKK